MGAYKEKFLRDGYLKIQNVFQKEELKHFIDEAKKEYELSKDIISYKTLWKLLINENVLKVMNDIFNENIHFNCDSNLLINASTDVSPNNLLHRDNQRDYNPLESYEVGRFAIYLDDYTSSSHCLSLVPGSHKTVDISLKNLLRMFNFGNKIVNQRQKSLYGYPYDLKKLSLRSFFKKKRINVPTRPGDLVVWNLRTLHQGYSERFKLFRNFCIPNILYYVLPKFLFLPKPKSRDAIFFVCYSFSNDSSGSIKYYTDERVGELDCANHWDFKPNSQALKELARYNINIDLKGFES